LVELYFSILQRKMRAVAGQLYQSERPFVVDHGKFAAHLILHQLHTPKLSTAVWTGINPCPRRRVSRSPFTTGTGRAPRS
jgi:hypothetical protein